MDFLTILKRPSAWIPIGMSLAALAVVILQVALFGVVRGVDEGTAAHLWQFFVGGQLPFVAYFAIKWLPQAPRQALLVLALQAAAGLAALAPVYFLHL